MIRPWRPRHHLWYGYRMKRTARAHWTGGLKDGNGTLTSASGVLKSTPYSFHTRFEDQPGTNPEELIAAAHAGCFAMALSGQLGTVGLTAQSLEVICTITMEKLDAGWTVVESALDLVAKIPGAPKDKFDTAAANAKAGCPISRLLNAEITLTAELIA